MIGARTALFIWASVYFGQTLALQTPCPHLFNYDNDDVAKQSWMGELNLEGTPNVDLEITVVLDRPAKGLQWSRFQANLRNVSLLTNDKKTFVIKDFNEAEPLSAIGFNVIYDTTTGEKPSIAEILINNRTSCRKIEMLGKNTLCSAVTLKDRKDSNGILEGFIKMETERDINQLELDIIFDKKIFSFMNYLDVAKTMDSQKFTIRKANYILTVAEPVYLKFSLTYNEIERIPNIQQVLLNGDDICNNHFDRRDLVVLATMKAEPAPATVNDSDAIVFVDIPEEDEPTANFHNTHDLGSFKASSKKLN